MEPDAKQLSEIESQYDQGDKELAKEKLAKLLIKAPENEAAIYLAAEFAIDQNERKQAIELLSSIKINSALGVQAVIAKARLSIEVDEAINALTDLRMAIEAQPQQVELQGQLWRTLNHLGQREESSKVADTLCRMGAIETDQLTSLLQRNRSFPPFIPKDDDPKDYFADGLGMARWFHSQGDLKSALEELNADQTEATRSEEEHALKGRILTELQKFESVKNWISSCNEETQRHSDFWAALGNYLLDKNQYEGAARALMEALIRDPTDHQSTHRFAKSLDALNRPEDAKQARYRAILLVQLRDQSKQLALNQKNKQASEDLPEKLMELGRPFESLNWTRLSLPEGSDQSLAGIHQQLQSLSRNGDALVMSREMSQIELKRSDFDIQNALAQSLRQKSSQSEIQTADAAVMPLARPDLRNRATEAGLEFLWYQDYEIDLTSIPLHEVMGGGIAVADYDLDGWPDAYMAQGSGEPPLPEGTRSNLFFRNRNGRFTEVTDLNFTADRRYSSGVTAGDVNQDGFPDLWVGNLGQNRLLVNNGDGTFRDATNSLNTQETLFTSSLAVADINGDRLPDLFEATYVEMESGFRLPETDANGNTLVPSPLSFYASPDRWFENQGDGTWIPKRIGRDVAEPGTGLGLMVCDFDADGINEIFIANDGRANHLLKINEKGLLVNAAGVMGLAASFDGGFNACMGIASGDFDRNGLLDLHVSNFSDQSNNHYLQNQSHSFSDLAIRYGHSNWSSPHIGFGIKAIDIDRNGWLDLIATNGNIFDLSQQGESFQMPAQIVMGIGNRFELINMDDHSDYWEQSHVGRAMTKIDFNRDGRTDFLISHLDHPAALLENQTKTNGHWLQVELVGTSTERDGIGAKVMISEGDKQWHEWVTAGDGYLSSDEPFLELGLGAVETIQTMTIVWPSGGRQEFHEIPTNQRLLIIEGQSEMPWTRIAPSR